jgi:tRNA dimethylallyltransferase
MISFGEKIIVIAGPTASGKSDIALKVAKKINGYIINADSRQIYTKLNIGTAKPTFEKEISKNIYTISGIKHYLYNYVDPKSNYSLYDYQKDVQDVLNKEKGIPILVGGTGLYIDSIVFNYELYKKKKSKIELREKTVEQLQVLAKEYLNDMTESDRKNKHRLVRVIERGGINERKGKPLNHIYFVLDIPKDILKERVRERIDRMFEKGLLEENIQLLQQGYTYEDRGMNSIGYIEFKEYFEKSISLDEVKEQIFKNSMSYIKRQRTWFKRNKESIWTDDYKEIVQLVSNFIFTE